MIQEDSSNTLIVNSKSRQRKKYKTGPEIPPEWSSLGNYGQMAWHPTQLVFTTPGMHQEVFTRMDLLCICLPYTQIGTIFETHNDF